MRHVLIVNAKSLSQDAMSTFARDLGMDMDRFGACLAGERHRTEIQKDITNAQAAGFSGTPTFVLGPTSKDAIDGVKIVGALPYAVFEAKIRELLRE